MFGKARKFMPFGATRPTAHPPRLAEARNVGRCSPTIDFYGISAAPHHRPWAIIWVQSAIVVSGALLAYRVRNCLEEFMSLHLALDASITRSSIESR